jgi:hypothetical protein
LKLSPIIIDRAPPPCRQDISAFAGPHNLEANTVSDTAVEDQSQRVENYRLSGRYSKQLQLFEHPSDLIYKRANLLGELPRDLLQFLDDRIYPIVYFMLEKASFAVEGLLPFPSNTSSSSTVLLRRPFCNSSVLRCETDSFGSVRVSITEECNSLSMRPRTTSETENPVSAGKQEGVKPTLRMRDVYLVGFSQLRESAETRLNHGNSFRSGRCCTMVNVGCDDIEKCHLVHLVFVSLVG